MSTTHLIIGTLTLTAPHDHTESFECAAWHRTVTIPAGTYQVRAYLDHGYAAPRAARLYVLATGTVKSASFQSLFGGVAIPGTRDRGRDEVGKAADTSFEIAAHDARLAVTHPGIELLVEERSYEGQEWSDEAKAYVPATKRYTWSDVRVREGWRRLYVHAGESSALSHEVDVVPAGELPRAQQIEIAAGVVARAKAANGYWQLRDHEGPVEAAAKIITHADVRARFVAAVKAAGVSTWRIEDRAQAGAP